MTTPDLLYLALITLALALDHFAFWPRFQRASRTDPARARRGIWSAWMGMLWGLVAAGVALWLRTDRAWASLGLHLPGGWRLWGSAGLVLALAALYLSTFAQVTRATSARKSALRARFGDAAAILPHARHELPRFVALSLTAGVCEEFVFRGYLIWVLQPVLGLWGAAAVSCAAFAAAHAYQGTEGILKTGLMGALLTLVVLASGSLLPAIVLHALVDVGSGSVAWLLLREAPMQDAQAARAAEPA